MCEPQMREAIAAFLRDRMCASPNHFVTTRRIELAMDDSNEIISKNHALFARILREEIAEVFGDAKGERYGPLVGFRGIRIVK